MDVKATYDPEADAIGVFFRPSGSDYMESEEVAPGLTLDFDRDGRVIGLEILGVRQFMTDHAVHDGHAAVRSPAAE